MGFLNLLNKRCSWRRRIIVDRNRSNEPIFSDLLMGSDVPCSRQVGPGMNMREKFQNRDIPATNKKLVKYFLLPTDIQEGDLITFEGSETEEVRDVRDAAGRGHHLEIVAESIKVFGEGDNRVG